MKGQALRKARDGRRKHPATRTERRLPHWISFLPVCVLVVLLVITPAAGASAVDIIATDTPDPVQAGDELTYTISYDTNDANVTVDMIEVECDGALSFVSASGSFNSLWESPNINWVTFSQCGNAGSITMIMGVDAYAQNQQVLASTATAFPSSYPVSPVSATLETTVINPPLQADFISNVTGGWVPFSVGFTDASQGPVITWEWDFGDGGGDLYEIPYFVHIYDVPGIYDLSLTVYDGTGGSDSEVKAGYITATEPITADFEADVQTGPVPLTILFSDNSTGTPETWYWDFGDGGTSTDQDPLYSYESAGTYAVSLTAGNDFGSDTTEKASYITVEGPASNPVHNRDTGLHYSTIQAALDDALTLDGHLIEVDPGIYTENIHVMKSVDLLSVSGNPADTVIHAADDSEDVIEITVPGVNVAGFTLAGASSYTNTSEPAGVFLNDCNGCTLSNLVVNGNVHGIIIEGAGNNLIDDVIADGNTNNGITIANSSGNVVYRTLATGNWAGFYLSNAPYTSIYSGITVANSEIGFYILPGSDGVILEDCLAEGNTNTGIYLVQVSGCTVDGCEIINQPVGIILSESSGNSVWNNYFDNGINARDSNGINVWNITPTSGTSIIEGDWLGGNYWGNYTGVDVTGDGLGDTELPYTSYGYIQSGGDWHPLTPSGTVPAPEAAFIANVTSGPAPLTVSFMDFSTGAPDEWSWDFGDGTTSTDQNPVHTYISPGAFTVSLNVSNPAGSDVAVVTDYITVSDGAGNHTLTVGYSGYEYTSIQAAVDAASPGDTILVYPGVYPETVTIPIPDLTLRGVADGGCVNVEPLDGGSAFTLSGGGTTLTGFSIFHEDVGVYVTSDDNTIRSNIIAGDPAIDPNYGIIVAGAKNTVISGNDLCFNSRYAVWVTDESTHTLVSGNNIYENLRGVLVYNLSTGTTIINNTLTTNEEGICLRDSTENLVTRNQISGNGIGVKIWPATSSNRIFFNNIGGNEVNAETETATNAWKSNGALTYEWNEGSYTGVLGNYWSNYPEIDLDEDGVGDAPVYFYDPINGTPAGSDPAPLMEPWENYLITGQASDPPVAGFTIDVSGPQPYYLGDSITLHGSNGASETTSLFLTGPGLPANGAPLENIYTASQTGENATFTQAAVTDGTWEYVWDTAGSGLSWDTAYTIYAVAEPLALEDIEGATSAERTVSFSYPYVAAMPSASTIRPGDPLSITGMATGSPEYVAIWIFGQNFWLRDTVTVGANRMFQYDLDINLTASLSEGQYFVFVEHPMLDGLFEADSVIDGVNALIYDQSGNYFVIGGPGSLPSLDARDALIHMLSTSGDDSRTYCTFFIDNDDPPFVDVPGGQVTVTSEGRTSFTLGDEIILSGVNTVSATTCLFLVGSNLPVQGGNLEQPMWSVADSVPESFVVVDVELDNTWEYAWNTMAVEIDPGYYTVYAVAEPHDRISLEGVEYATQTLELAKPLIVAPAEVYMASGDVCDIVGHATGEPLYVRVWIMNDGFRLTEAYEVAADGSYHIVLDTGGMETGEYDVIIQHPMMNAMLDVYPSEEGPVTRVNDRFDNSFVYAGPGSLNGGEVVAALAEMLNSPYIDDTYTHTTLTIEEPWLVIEPVGNCTVGDTVHIEGTTNGPAGYEIGIQIGLYDADPIVSDTVSVQPGNPYRTFSFNFTTTGVLPDEYYVIAGVEGLYDEKSFWLIQPNQPPVANFTSDATEGILPFTVHFTDISTGDPNEWTWDFGDGSAPVTVPNPVHTYDASGIYNVTLTVGNSFGTNTVTKAGYITVSDSPAQIWNYSTAIWVKEESGTLLTDYPVEVLLTSDTFDFTHAQSDGDDIRFTDIDETSLSFWTEEWNAATEFARIWVKIPEIPANGSLQITMLSGNPMADDASDGEATFAFFDDFDGSELDMAKWDTYYTRGYGSVTVGDGMCVLESPSSDSAAAINSVGTFPVNRMVTVRRAKATTGLDSRGPQINQCFRTHPDVNDPAYIILHTEFSDESWVSLSLRNTTTLNTGYITSMGVPEGTFYTSGFARYSSESGNSVAWYKNGERIPEANYTSDTSIADVPMQTVIWSSTYSTGDSNIGYLMVDWAYIRPFIDDEPVVTFAPPALLITPVLYLPFNEESGSTAIDSSGYENDGTIYGATRTNGIVGGALNFSESGDHIQFSTPVDNSAPFTVEAWVKPAGSSPATNQYVIANGGETSPSYGFALFYHIESGWTFVVKDSQRWNEATQNSNAPLPEEWTHLVGVWDGSQNPDSIKLYVNGECAGEATPVQYTYQVTERNLRIGAPTSTLNYGFLGLIDEVKLYPGVLSPEEIQSNYFEYATVPNDPVLELHFDEGEGSVTSDSSGNDQTTTITGATWTDGFTGRALMFDGALDSATTILSDPITGDLTLSLWMRTSNLTSYQQRIADLAPPEDIGMQISLFTDGRLLIDNSGGPSSEVWSENQYNDGIWHYVTGIRRGNSYELYVDGEFQDASTGLIPNYERLVLGNRAAVSSEEFNGTIDEVVLYKRALSPAEITDQYLASYTSPPAAAFTAFPVAGTAPLTVQFTDNSTQNPTAWFWDFGDGTNETSEAPSHEYTESGWYSPALNVSNSWSSDTIVHTDSIRVYAAYYTIGFRQDGVTITGTAPGQMFSYDTTSEIQLYTIENNNITVHAIDGGIMEITYHLNPLSEGEGVIFGPIESIGVRIRALMTEVPGMGMIFPGINLSLSSIPANAGLEVGIIGDAGACLQDGFDQAAGSEGLSAGSVAYCMDILPVNLTGVITNASVRMPASESFVDAYGAGNIRICRDHNGTFSVLDTKIVEAYPSTVYFEGLSPDGFSTFGLVGMHVLFEDTDPHDGRDDDTPGPSDDDEIPEEIIGPEDEEEGGEEIPEGTAENPPSLAPPLEPVLPELPNSGDDSLFDLILKTIDTETETARTILSQNSDVMSLCSMVQEGGARVSGIDGGDSGKQVPAGTMLPAVILPIAAVTTSLAMSAGVVAAGFVAQRAGTSVVSSFLGNLFEELRRIADFVTSFIGEHFLELIGEKEAGFAAFFAAGEAGAAGRLFSTTEMAVIGIGAILYGVAFLIADRASYIPVLIVSYIVVTGVAVSAHEIAHHMISRRYQVDSRVRIYYTGMVVSFLTAWLFGNVFAQPLMTHITDTENLGKRERGIIMLAGPAVSVVLALLFLLLVPLGGLWVLAGTVGFSANLLEAVYSLVPCNPMDGKHVCGWNRYVWLLLFVPAITIYILLYVL